MLIVISIMGILAATAMRSVGGYTQRSRVARAALVVSSDLQQAFTLAGRQRRPVRVQFVPSSKLMTVRDRTDSTLRFRRRDLGGGDFKVETAAFSNNTVDVLPNGLATDTLSVTLSSSGVTRTVRMSRAGMVRVQ